MSINNLANKLNKLCGRLSALESKESTCNCSGESPNLKYRLYLSSDSNQQLTGFGTRELNAAYFSMTAPLGTSAILMPNLKMVHNVGFTEGSASRSLRM